jgi:DNA-binding protein HU-beta
MTKADLVQEISKQTGIDRDEVLMIVESFMETVKGSLSRGKEVYLRGFGSFIIKRRAEKAGRNIGQNTTLIIPAHDIPNRFF